MNKQQAYQFVNDAIDAIFIQSDVDALENFYHSDASIHVGEDEYSVNQIKQRINFINSTYENRQAELHDVAVVDNAIVFQVRQTAIDKRNQSPVDLMLTGTYKLKDNKVTEAWLLTKENINYLETA